MPADGCEWMLSMLGLLRSFFSYFRPEYAMIRSNGYRGCVLWLLISIGETPMVDALNGHPAFAAPNALSHAFPIHRSNSKRRTAAVSATSFCCDPARIVGTVEPLTNEQPIPMI